jgi:hypothetical protein
MPTDLAKSKREKMEKKNIDIAFLTEADLVSAPIAELEALQTELSACINVLRQKCAMVAKVQESKENAKAAAKRAGILTTEEKAALRAHMDAEDEIINSAMTEEEKKSALDALNQVTEKPPTQNLIGTHITKDNDSVNPGK